MFFKVNLPDPNPTARPHSVGAFTDEPVDHNRRTKARLMALETGCLFLCFLAWGGWLPGVNESHYLPRAKGFWNPEWCANDLFISSPASHWLFYVSFGWITKFASLGFTAIIGRIVLAFLFAIAWMRLCRQIGPRPWFGLTAGILFLIVNDRFHLAGEWIVGGVEAKGFAYVFVLLALEQILKRQWSYAWILVGCAAAFHVLIGGWTGVALAFCRALSYLFEPTPIPANTETDPPAEPKTNSLKTNLLKTEAIFLGIGIAIAMIGILPPIMANWPTGWNSANLSSGIYVKQRLPHHLDFSGFSTVRIAKFTVMFALWLLLSRLLVFSPRIRRLNWFCIGALLILVAGIVWSSLCVTNDHRWSLLAIKMLRLYWFRLADFAIPLSCSLMTCVLVWELGLRPQRVRQRASAFLFFALIGASFGLSLAERYSDPRPLADQRALPSYDQDPTRTRQTYDNWIRVCQWIRDNTEQEAVFITPYHQQTFKWYAHRAEAVNWKDIPQSNRQIIEWARRVEQISMPQQQNEIGIFVYDDAQLRTLASELHADYLVVPQHQVDLVPDGTTLEQVYPVDSSQKTTYAVFRF